MHKLRQWFDWAEAHPKVWLDLIRIFLGLALFVRGLLLITNTRTEFVSELVARASQSLELSALVLVLLSVVTIAGAGPISVDGEARARAELPPGLPTELH